MELMYANIFMSIATFGFFYFIVLVLEKTRSSQNRNRESGATAPRSEKNETEKRREIFDVRRTTSETVSIKIQTSHITTFDIESCSHKMVKSYQPQTKV